MCRGTYEAKIRNLFLEFTAGLSQIETIPSSQLAFFSPRVRQPVILWRANRRHLPYQEITE